MSWWLGGRSHSLAHVVIILHIVRATFPRERPWPLQRAPARPPALLPAGYEVAAPDPWRREWWNLRTGDAPAPAPAPAPAAEGADGGPPPAPPAAADGDSPGPSADGGNVPNVPGGAGGGPEEATRQLSAYELQLKKEKQREMKRNMKRIKNADTNTMLPYRSSGHWVYNPHSAPGDMYALQSGETQEPVFMREEGWSYSTTEEPREFAMMHTETWCDQQCLAIYENYGPVCGMRLSTWDGTWNHDYYNFTSLCDLDNYNCKFLQYREGFIMAHRGVCIETPMPTQWTNITYTPIHYDGWWTPNPLQGTGGPQLASRAVWLQDLDLEGEAEVRTYKNCIANDKYELC